MPWHHKRIEDKNFLESVGPSQTILVTGAAGFIGKDVVARLLLQGWRVRAMMRGERSAPFPAHEHLEVVRADMRDAASLRAAAHGATVVVHLAAAKGDEPDSEDINVEGARRLVSACKDAGCQRLINISTQSAKIARQGLYARTKSEADHVFNHSGLKVTTLLPSVVYGEEMSGVFATVLGFVQRLPVVPVLGNGRWLCAPVYLGDLSQAIISCIQNDETIGRFYDIGGPELISFDEFIDRLGTATGIHRRKIHIPFGMALTLAKIVTKVLPHPPLTVSNVLGSNQNTDIDIEPARRDFGFAPRSFASGLQLVLPDALEQECIVIAQYLLGVTPPDALKKRYVAAHRVLLGPAGVEAELEFVRRHPFAWSFVEAGAGLVRPESIVRKKILLMSALLESTPEYADFFSRSSCSLGRLVWQALRSALKMFIGIPVFWLARRGS